MSTFPLYSVPIIHFKLWLAKYISVFLYLNKHCKYFHFLLLIASKSKCSQYVKKRLHDEIIKVPKNGWNYKSVFCFAQFLRWRPNLREENRSSVVVRISDRFAFEVNVDSSGDGVRYHQLRRDLVLNSCCLSVSSRCSSTYYILQQTIIH